MPTSDRMWSRLRRSSLSSTPSTTMRPALCSWSRLIVRMNVDLPEPDGPKITTTSPSATVVVIPASAWKSPNQTSTPSQVIMSRRPRAPSPLPLPSFVMTPTLPPSATPRRAPRPAR